MLNNCSTQKHTKTNKTQTKQRTHITRQSKTPPKQHHDKQISKTKTEQHKNNTQTRRHTHTKQT